MIIDEAAAEEPQPGMPLSLVTDDALVRRALLAMQQSIDAPLSIRRIIERLGVSRRNLERHFRDALGMTPLGADRLIRVEQAKHLLVATKRSATRIAAETGFCDLPHMIKVFRAAEGITPDVYRRSGRGSSAVSALSPAAGSS
jgi:transcriptional regulator GlxA family with amidase domain